MAITRPVTKTLISTAAWGIPITDQVNANAAAIANNAPTAWVTATLQNGFTVLSGYAAPAYRKVGDVVQIRGSVAGGAVVQTLFVLPVGFRPPYPKQWLNASYGAFGLWEINPDGRVYPFSPFTTQGNHIDQWFSLTS